MSTPLVNIDKQLEDKEFVKGFFRGVEDGNAVTQRLVKANATLNSPNLIAKLIGWLEEAEPSNESSANARARAEQELQVAKVSTIEEATSSSETLEEEASSEITSSGEESSDGTTRTTSPTASSRSSFRLGSK